LVNSKQLSVQARLCNFRSKQPALTSGLSIGGALLNGSLVIPAGLPARGAIPTWNGMPLCSSKACNGDITPNGAPFKISFGTGVNVNKGFHSKGRRPAKLTYTIDFKSGPVTIVVNAKKAHGDVRIEAARSVLSGTSGLCGNANLKAGDDKIPNKWKAGQFVVKASDNTFPSSVPQCPRKSEFPTEKKCSEDQMEFFVKYCEAKSDQADDVEDCAFDCCQGVSKCHPYVRVKGKIMMKDPKSDESGGRFSVNILGKTRSLNLFHFNPRYGIGGHVQSSKGGVLVENSKKNGKWQKEQRHKPLPDVLMPVLKSGQPKDSASSYSPNPVDMLFVHTAKAWEVSVNGKRYPQFDYKHRLRHKVVCVTSERMEDFDWESNMFQDSCDVALKASDDKSKAKKAKQAKKKSRACFKEE